MKRAKELAAEVRAYCVAHQEPAKFQMWARWFKEGYDSWGLLEKDNPLWTEKLPEWRERYKGLGMRGFFAAGEILLASGKYEEASLALRFITPFGDQMDGSTVEALAGYFRAGICNWGHTDVLCGEVIAPLLESGRVELEALGEWRSSDRKYQRRAVPVAMLGLVKAGRAAGELLEFVRPLMMDPERVVQQGLGWFLRETWKKQPKPVEAFLKEWKDRAPRLIYQYATEKMSAEQKTKFRRA